MHLKNPLLILSGHSKYSKYTAYHFYENSPEIRLRNQFDLFHRYTHI